MLFEVVQYCTITVAALKMGKCRRDFMLAVADDKSLDKAIAKINRKKACPRTPVPMKLRDSPFLLVTPSMIPEIQQEIHSSY